MHSGAKLHMIMFLDDMMRCYALTNMQTSVFIMSMA